MDKKFLDKVVNQIVSETRMDEERVYVPFLPQSLPPSLFLREYLSPLSFSKHCREVYGLNDNEVKYVWKEYREIVKDKIKNNGL